MIDNPIHLILWSIWAAIVVLAICLACRHIFRIYRTSWYDLSRKGPLAELEWRQIREVMENDPLEIQPCCRWPWKQFCLDFPVLAILTLFFWSSFLLIYDLDRFDVFANNINKMGLATGVFALAGTALAVFYNVRLTARAKNRQEWINAIRKHIHALIANFPSQGGIDKEHLQKCEFDLVMLELLINPGERVHRSLITIVRCMYGIHDHSSDKEVFCELRLPTSPRHQVPDNEQIAQGNSEELKVKATRLANVLLKREWEQVKHVK